MDLIIKKLINNISKTNQNKSSHWKKYLTDNDNFLSEYEHLGFGSFTKKSYKNYIQNILGKIIFGKNIYNSEIYKKYKILYDPINRYIDIDTIRHIFTFEKIKKIIDPKKICIIGDGKLNGVLGANITFPNAKIFSVNLSEVIINDYLILKKLKIDLSKSFEVVEENFDENNKKLYFIPSNLKKYLFNRNIDLFINIASFQEMDQTEINSYFDIIKNNKSYLYCCNREYKKLPGGEEIIFDKYPWNNSKIIFKDDCPWHQKFYTAKFPFIKSYDGNVKHCLANFS